MPSVAIIALVFGARWLMQPEVSAIEMPDAAAVRKASAAKPRGTRPRCDPNELVPDAPPGSPARRLEAELDAAIVAASPYTNDPSQLVVEQVSIPMPGRPRPDYFKDWSVAAFALIEPGMFECSELSADRFPSTAHLAPVADLAGNWWRLAARFNGARQWFAFSRARVNDVTGDAVAYYDRQCGGGCGVGEWVWFRRDAPNGPWRIAGKRWGWIE